ncbi:MAG: polysaccharide pyruvyl transferase CsaB [Oscillospiraceae bacterium]|nr:polysaccharide pyruvyl transferase CsaB [Oscillospiraceae bacterium]
MYNILISGYYGFDNIGDESILRAVINGIRARLPDSRLTVLSHDPAATRDKYGVEAVDRMSPLDILRAVRRCDMLISGGGSLLQDVTSSKSLHYYLAIIRLARHYGKKVFIYSQGIGPIDRPANRRATARVLRKVDGIAVRDERSANLLEEIGVPREKVVITADPVLRMPRVDKARGAAALRKAGVPERRGLTVGWAIRERDLNGSFVSELRRCILWLKEHYQAESVLIPFHYEEDLAVCRAIAAKTDGAAVCLQEKYLSEDMLSVIGNMDVLVGVRLHALIYAAIMGVPMIGISYDPKCTAFLRSVGMEPLSTRRAFTAEQFEAAFPRILEQGAQQTAVVTERVAALQSKLNANEDAICALLASDEANEKPTKGPVERTVDMKDNKQKSGVRTAGAIGLVFVLTLFAKLLGVVREMLQAHYFGIGSDADLYTASYNSTIYLFTTVCYALCIAAVPILTKEFAVERKRGIRAANNLMTVTLLGAFAGLGVWQLWASTPLVGAIWKHAAEIDLPRLVLYIRIMSLSLPVVAAAYLMVAMFQAMDHYTLQGSMSIPYNLFLAVFLFFFGAKLGIGGIVAACTFAWLLQLGMSVPYAMKEHYLYRPLLDLKADYLGIYVKTAVVTMLTTSVFLFCYLIDTSRAASFDSGAVSAFYFADKLFTPLITTVLYSISAVMFPRFNREVTSTDSKGYLSYIWNVTESTLLFILPVCAMMCAFGTDIIRVIFESGNFTEESTAITGSIFMMYAFGMCGFSALDLLNKAYYAMKKTLVPLLVNLGILLVNLALNGFFHTGPGVALATSIALTLGALAMAAQLFRGSGVTRVLPLLKGVLATAVMYAVLRGGHALLVNGAESKPMLVIKCVLVGAVGCVVYLGASAALRQEQVLSVVQMVRERKKG